MTSPLTKVEPASDAMIAGLEANKHVVEARDTATYVIRALIARIHSEREKADALFRLLTDLYRECESGADPFEAANIQGRLLINRIKPLLNTSSPTQGEDQ